MSWFQKEPKGSFFRLWIISNVIVFNIKNTATGEDRLSAIDALILPDILQSGCGRLDSNCR